MTAWQHDLIFQVGEPGFLLAAGGGNIQDGISVDKREPLRTEHFQGDKNNLYVLHFIGSIIA